MVEFVFDTARSLTDLISAGPLERHPGLGIVVPHCGGALPVLADRIDGFSRPFMPGEAPVPDASAQLRRLYYDLAGPAFPRQVPALLRPADPARLLYGSDYRRTPAEAARSHAASFDTEPAPVPGTDRRSLTTANARSLFPRLAH
ncbi:amidohydrolase family protein [Streptomyces eurythermus]|uniref:amidohydrolase family protein n=1 Tax=Streptomyces eurythermus TaxID=42237 RepID=UPI0033D3E5F5